MENRISRKKWLVTGIFLIALIASIQVVHGWGAGESVTVSSIDCTVSEKIDMAVDEEGNLTVSPLTIQNDSEESVKVSSFNIETENGWQIVEECSNPGAKELSLMINGQNYAGGYSLPEIASNSSGMINLTGKTSFTESESELREKMGQIVVTIGPVIEDLTITQSNIHMLGYEKTQIGTIRFSAGSVGLNLTTYRLSSIDTGAEVTKVSIPENIEYDGKKYKIVGIDDYAFSGCTELTEINLPDSLKTIGSCALRGCTSMKQIDWPSELENVGICAFTACTGLTEVTLPDFMTSIPDEMFEYCESLTKVNIPNQVTTIENGAFRGCKSLSSIVLPSELETIEINAFSHCSSLKGIKIPEGVTTIGGKAFGNTGLTSIALPNSIVDLNSQTFYFTKNISLVYTDNQYVKEFSGWKSWPGYTPTFRSYAQCPYN